MINTGIYKITLVGTKKIYIGRCQNDFQKRWLEHTTKLNSGKHPNVKLLADWRTFGADSFKFEIMNQCDSVTAKYRELVIVDAMRKQGFELYNVPSQRDNIIFEVAEYIHQLPNFEFEIDNVDIRCKSKKNSPLHWNMYFKTGNTEIYLNLFNKNKYIETGTIETLEENTRKRKEFISTNGYLDINKDVSETYLNGNCGELAKSIINDIMSLTYIFGQVI